MNEPLQVALHFTWDEALAEDVKQLGGRKKLAPRLWPSEDEEVAQNRLKAALSPGHPQQLKPPEILKIKEWARDAGSHALVNFEAQHLGFQVTWLDPIDEQQELDRDIRDLLQIVLKKQEQRERAQARAGLKVVDAP